MALAERIWNLALFGVAIGMFPASTMAAPITFNTALPVSQKEFIFRELMVVGKASDDVGGLGRDLTVVTANSVVAYGVTPDLALFGILPVSFKQLDTPAGQRETTGVGDARLIARYTIFKKNAVGKTTRLAPFVGIKAPTGANETSDELGLLPPGVQTGTGSWDVLGGVIATFASLAWNVDFQASYQANSTSNGIKRGNLARADASFQYRLLPRVLSRDDKGFLYGVLEANLVHSQRLQVNGADDPNSGGTTLNLVPGMQYATRRWIAELAVQLPVMQDLNGSALEKDYTIMAGIRVNF
jgi:Putative MetA-pathway of phenol degradation